MRAPGEPPAGTLVVGRWAVRCEASRAVVGAFAVGWAVRLGVALALPLTPSWDGVVYERAAAQLAAGEGYTVRMLDPDWPWVRPTAFYPPGWPAVLSLVQPVSGTRTPDLVLQASLGALAILLSAALARRLAGPRAAALAAWLVALWPGGVLASASWMTEPLFTVALLLALLPLVGPRPPTRRRLGATLALSALAFGLAAYVRPTALAVAPLALGARGWVLSRPSPAGARWLGAAGAAALAALALLPLAPWMARNAETVGAAVVSSNGGANLYVGTLHARFRRIPDALDCPDGWRELERDRCRTERALARIAAEPLEWLALGGLKLAHTFGYEASPAVQLGAGLGWARPASRPRVRALAALGSAFWLALLLAAAAGLRRLDPAALPPWAAIAALALTHFVFVGGDRYHLPLVPLVAALAAAGPAFSSPRASRPGPRPAPDAPPG
jgi:hypothetical protein